MIKILRMSSIPFYQFPNSPLLLTGALGIIVALIVFYFAYKNYFNSPLNREVQKKKKTLKNEKKDILLRLEKIEQELNNL